MPQRRRLNVDERRQQILAAARDVYATSSYADTPVSVIAERAGASPALVFHYYGSKSGLYTAAVAETIEELKQRHQVIIDEATAAGMPLEGIARRLLHTYLDHIASSRQSWITGMVGGTEPASTMEVRQQARTFYVEQLDKHLTADATVGLDYALWGFFGFLDEVSLRWLQQGCPGEHRESLVSAVLSALAAAVGHAVQDYPPS